MPARTHIAAAESKGAEFLPDVNRYADAATELQVGRLTAPSYSSTLTAWYNRSITRSGSDLLFCCDRTGSPQAFLMNLRNAGTRQLTEAEGLDGASLALERMARSTSPAAVYTSRCWPRRASAKCTGSPRDGSAAPAPASIGMATTPISSSGKAMARGCGSPGARNGKAHTVLEAAFPMSDPVARPGHPGAPGKGTRLCGSPTPRESNRRAQAGRAGRSARPMGPGWEDGGH